MFGANVANAVYCQLYVVTVMYLYKINKIYNRYAEVQRQSTLLLVWLLTNIKRTEKMN